MAQDSPTEVRISSPDGALGRMMRDLEEELPPDSGVTLRLSSAAEAVDRTPVDPTILVALLATGGTALPKLIQAVFSLLDHRQQQKIVLKGRGGRQIEVPARISNKRLQELIATARDLDVQEVKITK